MMGLHCDEHEIIVFFSKFSPFADLSNESVWKDWTNEMIFPVHREQGGKCNQEKELDCLLLKFISLFSFCNLTDYHFNHMLFSIIFY